MTDPLDDQLRALADQTEPRSADPVTAVQSRMARRARRRWTGRGAATLGAIAAIGMAMVGWWPTTDSEDTPARSATTAPVPTDPPSAPALTGAITDLDPGPLSTRHEAAIVDTGTELVVWGGDIEGSNFGRPDLGSAQFNDGATFNWAADTWRSMSPSPLPASEDRPIGVWTGAEVVIARGAEVAAWNPTADSWRSLADLPAEPDDLIWTGSTVLASGPWVTYDASLDRWRDIAGPPEAFSDEDTNFSLRTQWIDNRLFVVSGRGAQTNGGRLTTAAYEPESDSWSDFGEILIRQGDLIYTTRFQGDLVAATSGQELWRFDPASGRWSEMADLPLPDLEGGHEIVAIGDTLLAGRPPAAFYTTDSGWITAGPPPDLPIDRLIPWNGRLLGWGMVPGGENRFVVIDPNGLPSTRETRIGYVRLRLAPGEAVAAASLEGQPPNQWVRIQLETPVGPCWIVDEPNAPADDGLAVATAAGPLWDARVTCDDPGPYASELTERLIADNRTDN